MLNILQDYLGNKRLQLSGELVSLLFEVISFSNHFIRWLHYVVLSPTVFFFVKDLFKRMNLLAMDIMGKTMSNNTSEDRDGVLNFKQAHIYGC